MNIPCKDCLVLPACKHKYYEDLIFSCRPISDYLTVIREKSDLSRKEATQCHTTHKKRAKILEKTLKPSKWKLTGSAHVGWAINIDEGEHDKIYWGSTYF